MVLWCYGPVPSPPVPRACLHAEQFAMDGMAVVAFDYRGFGGSDGTPRHHVRCGEEGAWGGGRADRSPLRVER